MSLIGHRWEETSHNNKCTEVGCVVVTHGARMCDPGGVYGGVNAICRFTAVGLLPGQ